MAALPAIFAASAVLGGIGAIQQGRQANAAAQSDANMAEYNAKMAEIQAGQTYAAAGVKEEQIRRQGRAAIGQQLASSAQAGAGLNADLLRESVYGIEDDAMAIRYDADLKAAGLRDTAAIQRSGAQVARDRGRKAVASSYLNAASSMLNAGTGYYGMQSKISAAKAGVSGKVT